jgi:RNA polymerase sigma-70 factor (family 1)
MRASFLYTDSLVLRFRKGDTTAFDIIFERYYKAMFFFANKIVKDDLVAEDICTDSFVKLWEKRDLFVAEPELRNYLYKMVYNFSLKWIERERTKDKVYSIYTKNSTGFEKDIFENLVKAETFRQLNEAIEKLPSECKKVFVKLYVEGKSVSETAEELNVAVSTVKNQKARGVKLLKEKLASSS